MDKARRVMDSDAEMKARAVDQIVAARAELGFPPSAPVSARSKQPWQAKSTDDALRSVRNETGVDLGTSRLRVGFARGHLLEVVVQVPLDVPGDLAVLESAADLFLELTIDRAVLDAWVGAVDVDRVARTTGLLMVSDSRAPSESFPLSLAPTLIERGVAGVQHQLPESMLAADGEQGWVAFDVPPSSGGLQSDRRFASTCCPEGLKAALEGLPFSSCRFTRGAELFVWLGWDAKAERAAFRDQVERAIGEELSPRHVAVVGSGFGPGRDYLDLWVRAESESIVALHRTAQRLLSSFVCGFYDDDLRDLSLSV